MKTATKQTVFNPPTPEGRWIEQVNCDLREPVGFSDQIEDSGVKHQGWFADVEFQDEVYRGVVYRLPRGRFLYGYADPCNPDCGFFSNEFAETVEDAARWADSMAEHAAEVEREYQAAWRAGRRVEDLTEDLGLDDSELARRERGRVQAEIDQLTSDFGTTRGFEDQPGT